MKIALVSILSLVASVCLAKAEIPEIVKAQAALMQQQDVRTVIKAVQNTDGNPCMEEGESYEVTLQYRTRFWDPIKSKVRSKWETAKSVNVSKTGDVMEVCAE
jgi:hypothetical protein